MRKNVTLAFSHEEYMRLQGKAALAQMPLSTYIKWLLDTAAGTQSKQLDIVLERLDQIGIGLAKHASGQTERAASPSRPASVSAEVISSKLRERGIPTSTIRQVVAVLQDVNDRS